LDLAPTISVDTVDLEEDKNIIRIWHCGSASTTLAVDPNNATHRAYAIRDSEALFYAMQRAQSILIEYFDQALAPTMGNACIKIFRRHLPEKVTVRALPEKALAIVRDQVMRGGFCFCVGRFEESDLEIRHQSGLRCRDEGRETARRRLLSSPR